MARLNFQPQALAGANTRRLILLLCVWLVGMAHIFLLPPWEGYDETAHWSYIQQLSDDHSFPRAGVDKLSADLGHYRGPFPYAQPGTSGSHSNYSQFASEADPNLGPGPSDYSGAGPLNWEAQHPPLFYALMVPVYRLTQNAGWKKDLLALRSASWLLAICGIGLIVFATPVNLGRQAVSYSAAVCLWPFAVPEFFPEMARLGNDSLCLLIASALWVLAINVRLRTSWWASLAMGSLLGLGLLTKAFFIPIGASVVAVALLMRYRDGIGRAIMHAAVIAITASMVSAWWYLLQLSSTGVLSGGNEFAAAKKVGLMAGLSSHLQILPLMKALFGIISTATWAGTWSFAVYHAWLLLPLLLLPGLPLVRSIVKDRIWLAEPGAVAMLFLLPFLAGLVYHELAAIASGHVAPNTPGWYLHILIGPISYLWAMGLRGSKFEKILFAFVFSLTAVLWLCQISVFDGVATLDDSGHLPLSTPWWHVHLDPLSILGYPGWALSALIMAAAVAIALLQTSGSGLAKPHLASSIA